MAFPGKAAFPGEKRNAYRSYFMEGNQLTFNCEYSFAVFLSFPLSLSLFSLSRALITAIN